MVDTQPLQRGWYSLKVDARSNGETFIQINDIAITDVTGVTIVTTSQLHW